MEQSSALPKPRRWLRRIAIAAGVLVVLLVAVYFVVTSAGFLKGVILPKVSSALNAEVTISDADISPFSKVVLKNLKVTTRGAEPLITASEVRAHYSLWDIIGGNIKVAEVALVSPIVTIVENADGSSNLDPITKSGKPSPSQEEKPAPGPGKSGASVHVDLSKFALTDATVRIIKNHPGGGRDLTELSKVNITLNDLKNGQTGKLAIGADISLDQNPPAPGTNAALQARFDSSFELGVGNDLNPSGIKGGVRLNVTKADGSLVQLAGFALAMDTDVATDLNQQSAVLKNFSLTASQNQRPLLLANLSSPFHLAWGKTPGAVGDSTLDLTLTNLNLADWKSFAPEFDPSGTANATLKILSRQGGKQVGIELATRLDNLGAKLGSNRLDGINMTLSASGEASDSKQCRVASYRLSVDRRGDTLAKVSGSAVADLEKKTADLQVTAEAFLDRLLSVFPQPNVNLSSGRLKLEAKVAQGAGSQSIAGSLDLAALTGGYGAQRFTNLSVGTTYDIAVRQPQAIDLRQLQITLAPTTRAQTNAVSLTGQIDLSRTNEIEGALKLAANTLDITPYYDLVADQPKAASQPPPSTKPETPQPVPSGGSNAEPAAVQLPIKLLTFDVNLNRCFLREVDLSNVVTTARIEGSHVTLKPVQFALNGRPANADVDLNLGVPGFQYVVNFSADRLPLEPIANSFSPEYRGRAKGEMLANIQLKGAGVTGPSLRKNLSGNLGLNFTNADIQIVGPRLKGFLTPIATALNAPGLLTSPLHWAGFDAKVGEGKIGFSQLALVSPAFAAATKGEIPMADDLLKSRLQNWPMSFQLDRALAEKLRLAPRDTPTNATHVALPDFIKVAGTAGEPKPELDLKALAGAALMKYVDKIPGVDEKTSQLLKGVGAKLSGQNAANTNSSSTNAPAASKLFDALKNLKK
jgi:hypothetical protein